MRNLFLTANHLLEARALDPPPAGISLPEDTHADNGVVGQTNGMERKCLEDSVRQEQKLATLGLLATGIVYDFNNLLTAILGHCDILLRQPRLAGVERESVEQILRVGEWGTALTRQLLTYAREQAAEPQTLDVRTVIAETHGMLRRLIGVDIELETVLGPTPCYVRADPALLEQLLVHLVVNACEAMPEGGRIAVEASEVPVEASVGCGDIPPGAYVRLAVADSGSDRERGEETGLGFWTVRQIAEQCGGYVALSRRPGRDTRVEVYLPRFEEAAPAELPRLSRRGSETILVVEDETAIRDVICRTLRQEGYTILEAGDGAEAVAVVQQHQGPIQLLISDLLLPRTSAPALVARLTGLYPDLKVLYLSGYRQQPEGSCLPKPFTLDCLTRMVRETLAGGA